MAKAEIHVRLDIQNLDEVKELLAEYRDLIDDLRDLDPCWYDHHGYCQAHGWMDTEPECPHARAARLFAASEETNDAD